MPAQVTSRNALALVLGLGLCGAGSLPVAPGPGPAAPQGQGRSQHTLRIAVRGPQGSKELTELAFKLRGAGGGSYRRIVLDIDTPAQDSLAPRELELALSALHGGSAAPVAWIQSQALGTGALLALSCDAVYCAQGAKLGAFVGAGAPPAAATAARQAAAAIGQARPGASPTLLAALPAMADAQLEMFDVAYADRAGIEATTITDTNGVRDLEQRGAKILRKRPLTERPLVVGASEADRLGIVRGTFGSFEDLVRDEFGDTPETVRDATTTGGS